MASDARLVTLVRQGWPAAFEAVYNRHHRGILSFCRHVLSDADEAEDAVQHTFLAAYNGLITSDKPIHLRAWLFTIARNRCYSMLRARREQPAANLDEPVTEGLATQVQRRQDLRDLVVDLRDLPDEQRAALVLAELDALSHEEIGAALGVPREKVKALVFQARESLVASRTARETACADIREQLSNGRGGALRRANLRRHLRDCSGCRDFRRQVERQRRQLAALLPVVPTMALKETVLTGTGSAGAGGAGFSGSGLLASSALKSGVLKGFATLMLATAGTAGTYVATHDFHVRTISGAPARAHPQTPPAKVSPAGIAPAMLRAIHGVPVPSHAHATASGELRHLGTPHLISATVPLRTTTGHLHAFGPLMHSRSSFPRETGSKLQTNAPPKSSGKPPAAATPAAVTLSNPPTAPIPTTSTGTPPGDLKSVGDRPSPGGDHPGDSSGTGGGGDSRSDSGGTKSSGKGDDKGDGDKGRSDRGEGTGASQVASTPVTPAVPHPVTAQLPSRTTTPTNPTLTGSGTEPSAGAGTKPSVGAPVT